MIYFSKGTVIFFSIIRVQTPLKYIIFYIILINIPFLLYIKDIDRLGIKFNNFKNILI
jgi:hypothetical protein